MTIQRSEVIDLLGRLPDPIEVDELIYQLYMREKRAEGEAAIAEGRTLTTEQVRARLEAVWQK